MFVGVPDTSLNFMEKSVLWYSDNKVANLFDSRLLMSASGGKRCPFFGKAFARTFSEQFGRLFLLKTPLTLWTLHSTLKVTYFAHFPLLHWWNDFLLWIILFKLSKTKSLEIMFSQFKTTSISKTTSKIKGWDFFFMLLKLRKVADISQDRVETIRLFLAILEISRNFGVRFHSVMKLL